MPNRFGLREAYESRPPLPSIDTSTTAGILKAVSNQRWQHKMPMSSSISLPVPVQRGNKIVLSFFLYLWPSPLSDKKVLPPFARVEVAIGQVEETIEFIPIEPQDLNINVSPMTELGCVHRDLSYRLDEQKLKEREQGYRRLRDRFHESVDHILKIYPNSLETLSEADRIEIEVYKNYFSTQEEDQYLLPAYHALSPCFFQWLGAATSDRGEQPDD
jgi:hypothetical protein